MKTTTKKLVLLHGHGQAGPKGRRSYLKFGNFSTRKRAIQEANDLKLDGYRIAPKSKTVPSKLKGAKGLYYVKK